MQLVVVMAVRNAVSAATITFTAISTILFFIAQTLYYYKLHSPYGVSLAHWGLAPMCYL